MSRRQAGELALALALFALGTALYLGPSIPSLGGHLGPDLGDPRLNLYFASWAAHSLDRGFDGLWSPPFFHPTPGVLAYSDHLIGPGVALRLAGLAGVGPITAFNLLFLATFLLSGAVTFAVFRRLGLGLWPALLAGWFVAFSHARWYEVSHYQVLRAQWIPAVLYTFDRFLARPRAASAAAFLAFYLLHVSGGTYLAYMIHLPMAAVLAVRLRERGWRDFFADGRTPWLAGVGAAAMALLAPFVWGYLAEWGSRTTSRQLWEIRDAGALLASFFSPSHDALVRSLGIFVDYRDRGALFPGFVLLAGCVASALAHRRAVGEADRRRRLRAAGLAALGVAVTLWGLALADAFTLDTYEAPWLEALGLRRYNGPRLLAVAGIALIFLTWRRWPRRAAVPAPTAAARDPFVTGLLAGGALCLWLALPVGFTTLSRQLPGMSGMRVSHRFFAFAMLALAYLGARGLDAVRARLAGRAARAVFVVLVSLAAAAEAMPRRFAWVPVPERAGEMPAYVHHLATDPDVRAYVELPLFADYLETERMHFQASHWKPMVNGYSAHFPPSYRQLGHEISTPGRELPLALLSGWGVSHVVVHRFHNDSVMAADQAAVRGALVQVFGDGEVAIFRLTETFSGDSAGVPRGRQHSEATSTPRR